MQNMVTRLIIRLSKISAQVVKNTIQNNEQVLTFILTGQKDFTDLAIFIGKVEIQREKEKQRPSTHWFTPYMAAMAGAGMV